MIMNQKFIIRLSVALALVLGTVVSAEAKKADANAYQDVKGPAITVSGVVTDAAGEPLPGASVMIKGTTTGTVTDLDGNYSLPVKQGQTLVVSYIGFKDQEFAASKAKNNVALESDSTVLEDAVVVGYGSTKKVHLTGAVDQVTSEVFENRPIASVEQMLAGNMPNVSIPLTDGAPYRTAGATQIGIRGSGSIGGINIESDAGTLILIDGVEGDLSLINPNDIESISVLKDAASAAIYGSRGGYGVILVTTKSASEQTEKTRITYNGNISIGTPRVLADFVTSGYDYVSILNQAYYNYYGKDPTSISNIQPTDVNPKTYLAEYKDWKSTHAEGDNTKIGTDGKYSYYGNTNWYDQMYKKCTFTHIHNLSVTGNTGRTQYSVSGRYYDYSGLYVGKSDPYKTANLRAKVNTWITKWLRFSENIEYTYSKLDYGVSTTGNDLSTPEKLLATYGAPTWEITNPDGTWTKAGMSVLGGLYGTYAETNGKNKIDKNFKTTTGLTMEFFNKTFRVSGDFSYQNVSTDVTAMTTMGYYSDALGVLTPQQAAKTGGNLDKQAKQYIKEQFRENNNITANAYAEYENTWNKHYFRGTAGWNYESRSRRDLSIRKRGLDYDGALSENPWPFAQGHFESYYEKGSSTKSYKYYDYGEIENELKRYRNAGLFYRLNYIFNERFLLEVSGRYDGSSYFATGRQWNFFPSVSGGWRVSQEPWWHVNPKIISNLKFRASYGQLGDAMSAGAYNFEETFEVTTKDNRVIDGSSSTRAFKYPDDTNSSYSWATIKTQNYGVDVAFLNGDLSFSYDYYIRRITDMLVGGVPQPEVFGSESALGNNANSSTYGWELTARYYKSFRVFGKPSAVAVRAAISDNHTVVDSYAGNDEARLISAGNYRSGQVLGEIWGFRSNGIFQNQDQINNAFGPNKAYVNEVTWTRADGKTKPGDIWVKDLNGDNKITKGTTEADPGDMEVIGNKYAKLPFSFSIDLDWNNFFLNLAFQGVMHQDAALDGSHVFFGMDAKSNYPITKWLANNSWTESNTDAIMPMLATPKAYNSSKYPHYSWFNSRENAWSTYINGTPIDKYLFNVGYINLQNIQFGYNIPKSVLKKAHIQQLQVYFSGENIWNWSPFYRDFGRDFDVMTIIHGGDDYNWGLNWWGAGGGLQYPKLKTYSFGVSITF